MQQERQLTTEQKSVLEKAGEVSGIGWRITVKKAPQKPSEPSNQYGTRLSLGQTRSFASDQEHREFWINLISKAQPTKNIK
jgi:hypothetical protein